MHRRVDPDSLIEYFFEDMDQAQLEDSVMWYDSEEEDEDEEIMYD